MPNSDPPDRLVRPSWDLLFACAGALAIALQVTLLRELMVALSGDESAVGLGLAAWLGGIASGALIARGAARHLPRAMSAGFLGLLALSGPVLVFVGRTWRFALAPSPGELMPLGSGLLLAIASLSPAGALVGAAFTSLAAAAARAGLHPGHGIARLFVFESLGALAGGLAVTFLVVPRGVPLRGIAAVGACCLALMLPSAILRPARRGSPTADNAARAFPSHARPFLAGAVPLALLALVLAFFAASPLAAKMDAVSETMRFEGMAPGIPLLAWADTPYEHVAIGGGDIRFLYEGGQYAGTFPDPVESESRAHALACLTRHPARILAFGRGVLGPLRFLLRHPVERMDVVDPDRKAFDLVRRWMAQEDAAALGDPRVRIFFDDPRRFLAASRDRYDLILILEPDPVTLLRARLTTVEFYRLAADHLSEGGAVVASLTTAPNVVTGETAAMGGSIYGALVRVFPRVCAGPGPDGLLLAGTDPREVTLDPAVLGSRWRERQLASEVFVAEMFGQLFPPERVRAQEAALAEASLRVSPSRDDRPVSFLHALARRQAIRGGWMGGILSLLSGLSRTALAALALGPSVCFALFVLLRRSRTGLSAAALHATVVTGVCGMVWSLLILFSFQTVSGALYGQLGLLTALFMLGLAIGGRIASRAAGFGAERGRRWLLAACAIACLFSAGVGFATDAARFFAGSGVWAASLLHGALLLASGAVTALVFPVASGVLLASGRDAGAAAGAVESADHAGAAFAALLGAVVFIPVFGTEGTALLLAGLQALAFVILLRETQDVSRSAAVR